MRRGIWRRPGQPSLVDTFEPVQHGGNLKPVAHMYEQAPYIRRQDPPSGSETVPPPPASTSSDDPPPPPPTGTTTTTTSTTTPPPPPGSSTTPPTTTTTTPTSTRTTTTTPPTQPTISNPPPTNAPPVVPTSFITTTVTRTGAPNGSDGSSDIPNSGDKEVGKPSGFFSNKAAVGGVFGAVGVAVLILLAIFVTNAIRRSRARKFDREVTAAAASGPPGGYHDEDDEQPTYPFQHGNKESYDMHEFNGAYAHPYAAPGVAGAGAAGAAAGYYNSGHYGQGQAYGQDYNQHQSYPGYSDSGSSYPSTGPGYYDPRQQDQYAQPSAYASQSTSPPPREPPNARHMSPTYNGGPSSSSGYPPAAGMAGMGAYGSTGTHRISEAPSAYGGAERGAYAHMQRQDQLNRALSQRSSAPTYASHPSSGHEHALAGIVSAAGLGGAAPAHPLSPRSDERTPLPPMPPPPPSTGHTHNAPRTSGEHDAGNKSEGELPNPFRGRISGESISGDEWDEEESAAHAPQRVLKVANQ